MIQKYFLVILVMACYLAANVANAQLRVFENGRIMTGDNDVEENPPFALEYIDTVTALKIHSSDIEHPARLSFGSQLFNFSKNVLLGEILAADSSPTHKLWLHGKNGIYATQNQYATDTVFYYDPSRGSYVNFNYPIKSQGVLLSSDERFKDDVRDLDGALGLVSSLHSVTFKYKATAHDIAARQVPKEAIKGLIISEEARKDKAFFDEYYSELDRKRESQKHYGFLAQEVKQILPDLVTTDKDGYMYVDYIGLIPVLVNAIQELQGELTAVNGELAQLKGEGDAMLAPSVKPGEIAALAASAMLTDRTAAVLSQNDPNPFSSDTSIGVCLPEDVAQAAIYIYDLQGKQVRRLDVPDRGQTSVTPHGGDLQAGMYIYSLIADGKELASKKMILTK